MEKKREREKTNERVYIEGFKAGTSKVGIEQMNWNMEREELKKFH